MHEINVASSRGGKKLYHLSNPDMLYIKTTIVTGSDVLL